MELANSGLSKENKPKINKRSRLKVVSAPLDWRETRAGEVLMGLRETEFNLIHLIRKEAGPVEARKALMWFINGNMAKLEKIDSIEQSQEKL